jgi:hypothetical protein
MAGILDAALVGGSDFMDGVSTRRLRPPHKRFSTAMRGSNW